jgi:preprotein translocase subunit SecD
MAHSSGGRVAVGIVAILAAVATAGCTGGSDSDGARVEITLRAQSLTGSPVQDSDLVRAVAILEDRLDQAGIDGTVTELPGERVVVRLDRAAAADRVVELSTTIGALEFYDLEPDLVRPSTDDYGFPVATDSIYDLLVGRQSPAREDEVESWYLFDSERKLAGGPVPTKPLLLPSGTLRSGWRILGTPPETVILECGIGDTVCPGVDSVNPTRDFFYLIRHDPPKTPELDGDDLLLEGTRQDFDTVTGEPIVLMQFTRQGGQRFGEITRKEAHRGKQASLAAGGQKIVQHFAIVLDRGIKSWPSIDWEQYPNGISGSNGAQITGIGDLQEAKNLALVLQTGALPIRFVLARRETSG